MSVSLVGHASAAATSLTLPTGIQAGDLIIIFAYRNATTAPSLPSGYTNLDNGSGNSNAYRVGYKWAAGSDTSGTWTNANVLHASVYRGVGGLGNNVAATHAAATSAVIPSFAPDITDGSSWIAQWVGSRQTTSQGNFATYTTRGTQAGTTSDTIAGDTNGGVTSYPGDTSAIGASAVYAYVAVELYAAPPMSALIDPFNQTSLNTLLWTQFTAGSATMTYASTGASSNMPTSATASSDADITSNRFYNLVGSYAAMHVLSVFSSSTGADSTLQLQDPSGTNILAMQVESGTLYAQQLVGGSQSNLASVTFNATTHAYWRIREASGTIYWETSSDGVSWSTLYSKTNPLPSVVAMQVNIAGTCYEAESSPGTFKWNNFNNLSTTTDKTMLGKSRITVSTPKTLLGKSRITATTDKTQLGKSRISIKTLRTQLGLSRISLKTLKTMLGKARLTAATRRTQLGKSRLTNTTLKTITGKSRITIVTPHTQAGKSRLTNTTDRTQQGKSRLTGSSDKTIQGKAFIVFPISTLQDYFNQNALDTSKWGEFTSGGGTTAYDATGAEFLLPASATSSSDSNISSLDRYTLVGSYAFAKILEIPSAATNADGLFKIELDTSNSLSWVVEAGVMYAQKQVAGSFTDIFSVAYDPAVHIFWRIRESAGTIYWDTSPDAETWTNQTSLVAPFNVSSVFSVIGAACYENETNPGSFKVSNFNVGQTTTDQTITGQSRITVTNDKTQAGRSRITAVTDKLQLGKSRITTKALRTIQGLARLTATSDKTQTGKSRITKIDQHTMLGRSSIKNTTDKTQSGRARITTKTDRTQLGKSRITVKTTRNITGKGRITVVSTRQQLGRSRITVSTPHTQLGRSRLTTTKPQTIVGRARLTIHTLRQQLGLYRITVKTLRTQLGRARLTITDQRTLPGKSRITASTLQTMDGKARIIPPPVVITNPIQLGTGDTDTYAGTNDTDIELGAADGLAFPGSTDNAIDLGVDDTNIYGSP